MLTYTFTNIHRLRNIRHAILTRKGGASYRPFDSLNFSTVAGDSLANVSANFERLKTYSGAPYVVSVKQQHGDEVVIVDEHNLDALNVPEPETEGDALITSMPNVILMIKVADCQPVLLVDPTQKVVAAVHSGWRGSVLNIIGKTVQTMHDKFGCDPANIQAGIGPSLGPCCAEFVNYREELPPTFWPYKSGNDHFNFWRISAMQMKNAGIPEANIEISNICTVCNPDLFFSYRRDKRTGRFGACIEILES